MALRKDYDQRNMHALKDAAGKEYYPFARITWLHSGTIERPYLHLVLGHAIGTHNGNLVVQRDHTDRPVHLSTFARTVLIIENIA